MSRQSKVVIDTAALIHNFKIIKQQAPESKVWSVIKANAYGHGMIEVAKALSPFTDGFAVAHFEEAVELRECGITQPLLLLEGITETEQLSFQFSKSLALDLELVIHQQNQLDALIDYSLSFSNTRAHRQVQKIWLKMDSGMHRLGISPKDFSSVIEVVQINSQVMLSGILTHFACADDAAHPLNKIQLNTFDQYKNIKIKSDYVNESLASSSLIFSSPDTHRDWIRPGIALYGGTPSLFFPAASYGLKPVQYLVSKVIAIQELDVGDTVGYGATWCCETPTQIAIVGVGYGDGYPRNIANAKVSIRSQRCSLAGRVSMDMLAVVLPHSLQAKVGDEVECWGAKISVDEVAAWAGTNAYEILCQVTTRVPRVYSNSYD